LLRIGALPGRCPRKKHRQGNRQPEFPIKHSPPSPDLPCASLAICWPGDNGKHADPRNFGTKSGCVLSPLVFRKISERFPRKARAAKDYGARSDSHSTTGGSYRLGRAQIETDQINDVQKQAAAGFLRRVVAIGLGDHIDRPWFRDIHARAANRTVDPPRVFHDRRNGPELTLTLGALDIDDLDQLETLIQWI
jgi:hypothetical protein